MKNTVLTLGAWQIQNIHEGPVSQQHSEFKKDISTFPSISRIKT